MCSSVVVYAVDHIVAPSPSNNTRKICIWICAWNNYVSYTLVCVHFIVCSMYVSSVIFQSCKFSYPVPSQKYVKAFESYRITDRHTDTCHRSHYHATTRVAKIAKYFRRKSIYTLYNDGRAAERGTWRRRNCNQRVTSSSARVLVCAYTQIPRQPDIYTTATYLSDGHVRGSYPAGHPQNSRGFRYVTQWRH